MAPKKDEKKVVAPQEFDPMVVPTQTPVAPEAVVPGVPNPMATAKEPSVPLSDVKRLIAEALAEQAQDARKPVTLKKQTEHYAHLWRFEGKWVVNFKDQNDDPYVKHSVHAFNKYVEETRSFEPFIELVFQDGTTKTVSLKSYVGKRTPIYCLIKERKKIDRSYSIGEVEKKEWSEQSSTMKGTGKMLDQIVERYDEVFVLQAPDGEIIQVSDYAIA